MSAADLPRLLEIAASLPQAPHWPPSAYLQAIDLEAVPPRIALTATDIEDGMPLGFLIASLVPPEAELETIAVHQTAQRQGIGRLLMDALCEELRNRKMTKVVLGVRASNLPAIRLYRTNGFQEVGRRPSYYADPEEDALLLAKSLP
jgi:ribosomal-protein-alanine N-acetyltransferase